MDLIKKYLEEQTKDTGWKPTQSSRKDKFGNPVKTANVARSLARQAMQSAVKDLKKGPEAGKRQVEEVELDEASTAERKERNDAINNMHKGFYDKASKSKLKKVSKIGSDTYFVKSRSIYDPHESHFKTASGKYGSTMHSSEGGVPSHQEIHKDIKDHNPHLSKDEVKSAADVVHAHMSKHRLGEEVEQIDELNPPTVQKYITRAKFSTSPKRRAMAQKAQSKLQQKPKPMKTEEVEELDEVLDTAGSFLKYTTSAAADALKKGVMQPGSGGFTKRKKGIQRAVDMAKRKVATEETELSESGGDVVFKKGNDHIEKYGEDKFAVYKDGKKTKFYTSMQDAKAAISEGVGGTVVGAAAQFLGNKIDPLHGEIMRTHGEAAGRAAEYTIRKHLNKLHSALKQHLSTGKAVSEEVNLVSKYSEIDEAKYPGFRVRMTSMSPRLGPKLPRRGYGYVPQGDQDPRTGLPLGFSHPPKKDEPKKTEPSKN